MACDIGLALCLIMHLIKVCIIFLFKFIMSSILIDRGSGYIVSHSILAIQYVGY